MLLSAAVFIRHLHTSATLPSGPFCASHCCVTSARAAIAQVPSLGRQTLCAQAVSATDGQLTTDAGLCWHEPVARAQNFRPLHLSPSSCATQSASVLHAAPHSAAARPYYHRSKKQKR